MHRLKYLAILIPLALVGTLWLATAGDLEPPGAPAPTMKTLVDVEPRVALRNDFDNLLPLVIDQSGSYYLAEDILAFPNAHGIEIQASHVTLDLNGFSVIGNVEVGSFSGIYASPVNGPPENIVVRDGTVRDFFGNGIYFPFAKYVMIEGVRVLHNGLGGAGDGILVDTGRVKDCIVVDHPGTGIKGSGVIVTGSISVDNGVGIQASLVTESIARSSAGLGIVTSSNGVIAHSSAVGNGGNGIDATSSLVIGNATDGLNVVTGTSVNNEVN